MPKSMTWLFAVLFAFLLVSAGCSSDDVQNPTAARDSIANESGTIVDVAVGAGSFTTLVAAVTEAGLVDTLSGEGPFTVFAPTDDAFAAALEALGLTAEELLASPDLGDILTYHVVAGEVDAATATVVTPDVMASNGIIHVIDAVMLPPAS